MSVQPPQLSKLTRTPSNTLLTASLLNHTTKHEALNTASNRLTRGHPSYNTKRPTCRC